MISNYESTYEDLVNKIRKPNMKLRRISSFLWRFIRPLNNLNPKFMKYLFRLK